MLSRRCGSQSRVAVGLPYDGHDTSILLKKLVKRHFTAEYPKSRLTDLHNEYTAAVRMQSSLMSDGTYVELGGAALAELPNMSSIIICGGSGRVPTTCRYFRDAPSDALQASWLQNQFKDAGFMAFEPTLQEDEVALLDEFTAKVLRMLTVARTPFKQLVKTFFVSLSAQV